MVPGISDFANELKIFKIQAINNGVSTTGGLKGGRMLLSDRFTLTSLRERSMFALGIFRQHKDKSEKGNRHFT